MNKILLSFWVVVSLHSGLYAQYNTESHTTSATSASYESDALLIDYTIGELAAVTTIGNETFMLTQGLHQPDKFTVGINEWNKPWKKITAWPNPSTGTLNIETDINERLHLCLFDATGRLLDQLVMQGNSPARVDVSPYSAGTYSLVITSESGRHRTVIPFVRAFQ